MISLSESISGILRSLYVFLADIRIMIVKSYRVSRVIGFYVEN